MSAAAMQFYDGLLAKGVQADQARKIAEGFDAGREHDRKRAEEYADRAVAHSEEKGKATFATKDQVAKLATRDEMNMRFAEVRTEIRGLYRLIAWGMIVTIGAVCVVVAFVLRAVGGV